MLARLIITLYSTGSLQFFPVLKSFFSGHNYIGSEHLLLGLLREGEGVAARVLESLGADPSNIRTQVNYILNLSVSTETVFDSFSFH